MKMPTCQANGVVQAARLDAMAVAVEFTAGLGKQMNS
jgi:hypothetical protein